MIINVSNETREKIDTEFNRFMEDPNNMARLRMKLSYNQRAFLDALKERFFSKVQVKYLES